ncbi:tail fiber domain-containing protein [SAR92 clade bacterium H455]|uniref:Tail fiber domain-containing protein n=1 Tax=SAR92 clade bacterium H455 TaxID=2974818 RepID=A0ABY5TTM6_9GAMM|nr:tail fiber domain-containing protein [SAR92 clade bacterium H455]
MQAPTTISRPYPKLTILFIYHNVTRLKTYFLTLCLALFFPINALANNTGATATYNKGGTSNTAIGYQAGYGLTSGSHNIYVASAGANTESYIIRMGTQGKHLGAYIAGISGVTASGGAAVYINSSGQLGTQPSSQRFKKDIQSLDTISEKILNLRPVTFRYKQADEKGAFPMQFGLIAEEVARILPELVKFDAEGKPLAVFYHLLTPLLLSELQRGHIENQAQQTVLNLLLEQNALFEAELLAVRQQMTVQAAQIASFQLRSAEVAQQLAQ